MNLESLLTIIFAVVAVFALSLCGVLAYLYFHQKGQISQMIKDAVVSWREKESEILRKEQREFAYKDSLAQLESWRQQELDLSRKQQLETARNEALVQFEQWKIDYTKGIRQDAIQKSQSVIAGKVTEHFVPYLPEFKYNPKDARFLGTPIDFVIFDGLDEGQVKGIVFAEIKTGSSTMNTRERQVRDAVQAGKIEWVEIRPQLDFDSNKVIENGETEITGIASGELDSEVKQVNEKKNTAKRLQSILKK